MTAETSASSLSVKTLATIILIVALLYWAKEVFISFALAVLFSFVLGPIVTRLRRWGLGQILAVTVTALTFALMFSLGWVTHQLLHLARKLPTYKRNIQAKVQSVYRPLATKLDKTSSAIQDLQGQFLAAQRRGPVEVERVEVVQPSPTLTQLVSRAVGPFFRPFGNRSHMVTVSIICMLLNREDLRNRLIRLFGRHRLPAATQALDDVPRGVSRFLLMQSVINGAYGVSFALGRFLIGLPNSVLWGGAAAALRFTPFIGSWIARLTAIICALAVFDGWSQTLFVAGLFILLEIVSNYLVEPWLYGTRTGLSPLAVLLAAIFWAWLWGPVGLLLSTPLTVCVVVISKHIPQLAFFSVLLGDEPEMGPRSPLEENPLIEVGDATFVPVLRLASADRRRGALDNKRASCLFANLRDQISGLRDPRKNAVVGARESMPGRVVLCLPAQDEADELGALLFVKLLQNQGIPARQTTVSDLSAMEHDRTTSQAVVSVSALSLPALENAQRLIKPLRDCYPHLPILACLWDAAPQTRETDLAKLEAAGATQVATTLQDGLDAVIEWPEVGRLGSWIVSPSVSLVLNFMLRLCAIPAKAGIQPALGKRPASAGMTAWNDHLAGLGL